MVTGSLESMEAGCFNVAFHAGNAARVPVGPWLFSLLSFFYFFFFFSSALLPRFAGGLKLV